MGAHSARGRGPSRRSCLTLALVLAAGGPAAGLPGGTRSAAVERRTAPAHPMQYLVSRPEGWEEGKSWPVVLAIPGAERDFAAYGEAFVRARGARPYLIVTPYVLTNGGSRIRGIPEYPYDSATWDRIESEGPWTFDLAGLQAVLADVHARDGGEVGAFMTGLEAAGHTIWATAFEHAELLRAAAPVAPNYLGRWVEASRPSARPIPVRVFVGALDEGWGPESPLTRQTEVALAAAKERGLTDLSTRSVEGKGHEPLAESVLAWFDELRGESR